MQQQYTPLDTDLPRYMTFARAEELYSLSESDLRRMAEAGLIRLYRPTTGARKVLVARVEIERAIEASAAN